MKDNADKVLKFKFELLCIIVSDQTFSLTHHCFHCEMFTSLSHHIIVNGVNYALNILLTCRVFVSESKQMFLGVLLDAEVKVRCKLI